MALVMMFAFSLVAATSAAKDGPFIASISVPRVQKIGEDVTCHVLISNTQDLDYYLLARNTPLEGLKSHIFDVNKGTIPIKYEGLFIKRGLPIEEEYIRLPGKSSMPSVVVLSDGYNLSRPSMYSVKLETKVLYSKLPSDSPMSQQLSSNVKHFFLVPTIKIPKMMETESLRRREHHVNDFPDTLLSLSFMDPIFTGAWPDGQKNTTQIAYSMAFSKVSESRISVTHNRGAYTTWFGILIDTRLKEVMGVYNSVWFAMINHPFRLHYYGKGCEPGTFAYTRYNSEVIVLCKQYFEAAMTGYNSKMGILVHQLTHSVCNTEDVPGGYGTVGAMNVAAIDADWAIRNADAYEYYCESV